MGYLVGSFVVLIGVVMLIAGGKGSAANLLPSVFGSGAAKTPPGTAGAQGNQIIQGGAQALIDQALADLTGTGSSSSSSGGGGFTATVPATTGAPASTGGTWV